MALKPGGYMPYLQWLSNNIRNQINPIPPTDTYFYKIHSHIVLLGLPNGPFTAGVPVKILKALLPSSILAT